MDDFDHILNWKLKQGTHPFPGKDGGTCINEAALVAAGYEYKPIRSAADMPDAFSRPICQLALRLNDHATDAQRQRLLPYVTRLACADSPEVERERQAHIDRHVRRDYVDLPFERGLAILDGALAIGRRAEDLDPVELGSRLDAARSLAAEPSPARAQPFFARVRQWLRRKEAEPVA